MTKTRTEWAATDGERKIVEHVQSEILLVMNRKPKKGNAVKDYDKKFKSGRNARFDTWFSQSKKCCLGDEGIWKRIDKL